MKMIIGLIALCTSSFVMSTTPVRAQYGIEIGPGGVQVAHAIDTMIVEITMIVDIETSVGMAIKRPAQDAVAIDLLPMASIGHSRAVWSNRDIDCNLSAASIFFTEEEVLPTSGDRGNGEKVGSVLSWG